MAETIHQDTVSYAITYYEAWYVNGASGVEDPPSLSHPDACLTGSNWNAAKSYANDYWTIPPLGRCTRGTVTQHGELLLLGSGVSLPSNFRCGGVSCAGALPSGFFWDGAFNGEEPGNSKYLWSCCGMDPAQPGCSCPPDEIAPCSASYCGQA